MVGDHAAEPGIQWAAIQSIAPKIGRTAETLRRWVREAERTAVPGAEARAEEAARVDALEREVRALRQATEIRRKGETIFRHWSGAHGRTPVLRRRSATAR